MPVRRITLLLLPLTLLLLSTRTSAILPPLLTTAVSQALLHARSFLLLSARVQLTSTFFNALDHTKHCLQPEEHQPIHARQYLNNTACFIASLRTLANAYLLGVHLDEWFFGSAKDAETTVWKKVGRLLSSALFTEWVVRGDFSRVTSVATRLLQYISALNSSRIEKAQTAFTESKWYQWLAGARRRPIEVDVFLAISRRIASIAGEHAQVAWRTIAAPFQLKPGCTTKGGVWSRLGDRVRYWQVFSRGGRARCRDSENMRGVWGLAAFHRAAKRARDVWHCARGDGGTNGGRKGSRWVWWNMRD